jgi:hypothetical protein
MSLHTKVSDSAFKYVTHSHEQVFAEPNAGRGSCCQEITWQQNHMGGEVGHHLVDAKKHVAGVALLLEFSV